jgi:hypothetical protein
MLRPVVIAVKAAVQKFEGARRRIAAQRLRRATAMKKILQILRGMKVSCAR